MLIEIGAQWPFFCAGKASKQNYPKLWFLRSSGTQNMEKRMKRIGGTFSLVNTDGGGLRARASVSDPDQE